MAKALITGIAGFIGSSIASKLLEQGAQIVGVDDMSSGKEANLAAFQGRIDFRVADVQDLAAMRDACRGVDFVFHEAAIPSVALSVADPIGTNGPNLGGTLVVLQAAKEAGVKRLMYAASSAVHGDCPLLPKREDMRTEPLSPYAVQKLAGEHYLRSYARVFGLETVSLRYFNVFGPGQDPTSQYSGVLAIFISKMLRGETPTIYGDGSTSRDFVYIDNVVSANLLAAKSSAAVSGKVFNIATGKRTTLLEAYEAIKRITGYTGGVKFGPDRSGDIKHSVADISLAQNVLGYRPESDFLFGLEQTVKWYREAAQFTCV